MLPDIDISRDIERGMRALPRDFNFEFRAPAAGRLGVTLMPLGDQLAAHFGVKEGALVSAVERESPAAQAGLMAGDVITAVAGRAVRGPSDVMAAVRDASAGAAVEIRIVREKKEMTMKATIGDRRPARPRDIPI
jgi:serine protease Do